MSGQKEPGIPWPTVAITVLKDYGDTAHAPSIAVRLEAHVHVPNDAGKTWNKIDATLAARHANNEDESLRDIYHRLVPEPANKPGNGDLRGLAMLQAALGMLTPKRNAADPKRRQSGPVSSMGGWPIMDLITGTDGSTRKKFDPADRRFFRVHMDVPIRPDKIADVEKAIASGHGDEACDAIIENRLPAGVSDHATALVEAAFGVIGPLQPTSEKRLGGTAATRRASAPMARRRS